MLDTTCALEHPVKIRSLKSRQEQGRLRLQTFVFYVGGDLVEKSCLDGKYSQFRVKAILEVLLRFKPLSDLQLCYARRNDVRSSDHLFHVISFIFLSARSILFDLYGMGILPRGGQPAHSQS